MKRMDLHVVPLALKDGLLNLKARKRANIRNRYNQVPHLTQDTNGKVALKASSHSRDTKSTSCDMKRSGLRVFGLGS